jgi:PAS domain S-box-containing protein
VTPNVPAVPAALRRLMHGGRVASPAGGAGGVGGTGADGSPWRGPGRERALIEVLNDLPEGIVVVGSDGRLPFVNPAARDLLGLHAAPRRLADLPGTAVQDAIRAGTRGELVIAPAAGAAERFVEVDARALRSGGSVAVIRDVTDRKLADRRLAAHVIALESQLGLLDLAHDAVLIRDPQGRITYCNHAAEEMYGYPRAHLLGRSARELLDDPSIDADGAVDDALMSTGLWAGELRHRRADGNAIVVHSRQAMRRNGAGEPHAIIEINSDITARRLAEKRLRATEELQRVLLDGASDHAIFLLDPDGLVTSWSKSAERVTGYRAAEIVGQPYGRFFAPGEAASGVPEKILADALAAGQVESAGVRVRRDGTTYWVNAVVTAAHSDDGDLRGFVTVMYDDTIRHAAEQKIMALNAQMRELDRLKSDLVATVSHELRTPLTSIRGYTELLLGGEAGDLAPAQRRMLGVIDRNGARLLSLIEDVLAVASIDAGQFTVTMEPIRVPELLARVEAAARDGLPAGVTLAVTTPTGSPAAGPSAAGPEPWVTGDAAGLERALLKLLNNAVKFSPDGGPVTLGYECDGQEVRLTVADEGAGIAPEEQVHLFDRFFRTTAARVNHVQGTGLGLSLVKGIAEAHGGRVSVRSALGEGTTITLHLPLSGASQRAEIPSA